MQTNNDIINRLIEWQTNDSLKNWINEDRLDLDFDSINRDRIVSLKYRLYVFLCLIWIYICFFNFILPAWDKLQSQRAVSLAISKNINSFENNKKSLEKDKQLIDDISLNKDKIVLCLNQDKLCNEIGENLRKDFSIVRSYLQIWDLSSKKMIVNEKLILANINEYLIRNIQNWEFTKNKNWVIDRISIWDPAKYDGNLYYVPVRLNISFENKDYLLSFISNVERKILVNQDYRILYKIDQVSYDIVDYNDKQNVDIVLIAYYYQD